MNHDGRHDDPRPTALAWLVAFAQEDLASLSPKSLLARWQECRRFALDAGLVEGALRRGRSPKFPMGSVTMSPPAGGMEHIDLDNLQKPLRRGLRDLLEKGEVKIDLPHLHMTIRATAQGSSITIDAADMGTGFRYNAAQLLGDMGHLVRQCRGECGSIFVAGRSHRWFCSNKCQARIYKREHKKAGGKPMARNRAQDREGRAQIATTQRRGTHGTTR